ncbi:ABC transporter ATP-binding protein [Sphaerisporangium album]|uniref:ABC transporter ATP-binding protein n=1 Tax=Sphaerisporangium album TaxID=509200 RepID=A0A367F4Q0_9ACTN|nr:ABC transporter ATP-binding protein [Sphaerisporangium album]RCG25338.1 ABC transporter ATP-binding protein [Sphaerisporangium album]
MAEPTAPPQAAAERRADGLLLETVRRSGGWPYVYAVAALAGAVVELLLPGALGRAVDVLVSPGGDVTGVLVLCASLVTTVVVCDAVGVLASGSGGAQAARLLRERLVRRVLAAGPAMSRRFPPGDLVTRAGANAEEVGAAPEAVITAVSLLVPAAGSLVALALIDPWLAVAFTGGLAVILLVLRAFLRETTTVSAGYQEAQSDIASRLVDALAGARTIAAAGTEDQEIRRVLGPLSRLRTHGMALWRVNARAGVQAAIVVPLLETAVIGVGGLLLAAGQLTAGELFAAARYAVLGAGIGSALGYLNRLARARSAARRVRQVLDHPAVVHGSGDLPETPGEGGRLELRDVTVHVDGRPVLRDIDLVVPGGAALAVVGRSGSGKSALAAVAGRMLDPDHGEVLLDGVPLPRLARPALRRAVGYAFERPVLFGGTLREAIAAGRPEAPPDDARAAAAVEDAARAAAADAFVRRLPRAYDTPVDEAPMSGGERQRVGLARAFAHGGRLLILDDATSSLDTVTEYQVARALTEELRDRTRVIVAHRAGTAARADLVVWLEDGRVRAQGTHEALWSDPGYRAVFQVGDPPGRSPGRTVPDGPPSADDAGSASADDAVPVDRGASPEDAVPAGALGNVVTVVER